MRDERVARVGPNDARVRERDASALASLAAPAAAARWTVKPRWTACSIPRVSKGTACISQHVCLTHLGPLRRATDSCALFSERLLRAS